MVQYTLKMYKSALNRLKYIDSWFWCRYTLNGYNGCQIGCVYCDSRSAKYHLPTDFETDIIVKENISQLLDNQIRNSRTLLPDVVAMSGASDPYQAAEKTYKNTRKCLKVLYNHHFPVHLITKSTMVMRDLDLIAAINEVSWASISFTITTPRDDLAKFLEKGAPYPQQRLDMIKDIKGQYPDLQVGVLMSPIIPYIADNPHDLKTLVNKAHQAGADYLLFSAGLTMREQQAQWFLKHIGEYYPELIPRYEELFEFDYNDIMNDKPYTGKEHPSGSYIDDVQQVVWQACNELDLPVRMKRFIPEDYRKANYIIAEELLNDAYYMQLDGLSWQMQYWLAHEIQNLKTSIFTVLDNDKSELQNLNPRLEDEIQRIIDDKELHPPNFPIDDWF